MKFQERSCTGRRHATEKVICSPSKVTLIIDRSQPKLRCAQRMGGVS